MQALKNVDWDLLGKQKLVLLRLLDEGMFYEDGDEQEAMEGILNLLDEMTDENYQRFISFNQLL